MSRSRIKELKKDRYELQITALGTQNLEVLGALGRAS